MSARKPHMENAGYVTERKSKHPKLPGYFVVYDRDATPSPGMDADNRWIVMHEPSSHMVSLPNMPAARALMVAMANGSDEADFGQHEPTPDDENTDAEYLAQQQHGEEMQDAYGRA